MIHRLIESIAVAALMVIGCFFMGDAALGAPVVPPSSIDRARADVQELRWQPAASGVWFADLTLDGDVKLLQLEPVSVRADGFVLHEVRAGEATAIPAPAITTHRGEIVGMPGSVVAASFVAGGVRVVIDTGDGHIWYAQPLSEIEADAAPGAHLVYPAEAMLDSGHSCGGALDVPGVMNAARDGEFDTRANCLREAQIGLDLDYQHYLHHGSSSAASLADAESIINGMNVIFMRDVNVSFVISFSVVRTDSAKYNTSDIGALLGEIQAIWTTTYRFVARDVAHLFTGQPTGGTIGLAWVDVVCNASYEYAVSAVDFTGDYGARVGLVAHEVGHNFAAGHCDGAPDCSIMCSGLGGCAGNLSRFSETVVPSLKYAAARYCLKDIGPSPTPGGPGSIDNSYTITTNAPARLDVLSNDSDPNCDPLSIVSFESPTFAGATLSISVGTGAGGRDEILYTPRSDAAGYDTFLYTIADPSGATSTARVYMSNQTLRDPDDAGATVPGLDAQFYRAGGPYGLPDFALLSAPFKTSTFANIAFNRRWGNVLESGKNFRIGVSLTGEINIPAADTYTFFTSSEDGSMLFIDGMPVVKNDGVHNFTEASGAVALSAGTHAFRVEFFVGSSGGGGLVASWQSSLIIKQVIPASAFTAPGITVKYYDMPASLASLPSFDGRTPYKTSVATELNVPASTTPFLDSERSDEILASFDGYFVAPADGVYTFFTESDDGSKLMIGTNLVVNNDGVHGMVERSGAVQLKAGTHKLRIEFFEISGSHGLIARVQGPGIDKQVIPASMLVRGWPCAADFNHDGFLNGDDFDAYLDAFELGELTSDFNGDGFVNGDDFDAYVLAFEIGC